MEDPEDWLRLVRAQDGLVTRRQALARGITPDTITAHLDAGRWTLRKHGVLATFTGPLTPEARRRAALLFVPGPAALSHRSAAAVLGLRREDETGPVHVAVPYGSSARGCEGVAVHRSRAFDHIAVDDDPPRVSKVHTIVDLAVDEPDARRAMRTLTALAAGAQVPAERLEEALELRRPRRYLRPLRDAVTLLRDGVGSLMEADWALDVEQAHGLPAPQRQVRVIVEGRHLAEDLLYAMPLGDLLVRLDGWRYHANTRTARRDRARDNAAELAHRARMVFGWEETRHAPCEAAVLVGTRLTELGWQDELQRCTACR
ncbi:hypothetical protein [Actinomycetospora aeridis]|uniref:Transcriptional regulator, AbiEi antitoxin, Type IV TA system n=1 Tax=Actinomycetospora aeridis TaxID=3129231 RepID=A0ABU8N7W7_9PSEU